MKILHFGPNSNGNVFSLLKGFEKLGHQLKTCPIVHVKDTEKMSQMAIGAIEEFKPDMVLTVGGWHAHYEAKALWAILKRYGLPHAYWAIEDPTFFDWSSTVHLSAYDFVFTVSELCLPMYRSLGTPSSYLPYCIDPDFQRPYPPLANMRNDIIVLSNKIKEYDPKRCAFRNKCYRELIEPVWKAGYDIKIYGAGWDDPSLNINPKYVGGYTSRREVSKVYSSAKIVLMIQWDNEGHICYKTYEAMACKCLQLAPYTAAQQKYFKHGEHLIYVKSTEEVFKYIEYYLKNDEERNAITQKAQEEVYKNHNCSIRAKQALEALKDNGWNIDFICGQGVIV